MKIKVSEVPESGLTLEGDVSPEEIDLRETGFRIDRPVRMRIFVEIVDDVFVARGSYEGEISCNCDRCLKAFTRKTSKSDYLFGKEVNAGKDETIDLTGAIREDILLGLSLKMLCSDECKGICPQCGADLNLGTCSCKPRPGLSPFSELDRLT